MSQLDTSSSRQVQMPAGLTQRERAIYRKMLQCAGMNSISLAEFDRLWKQKVSQARHRSNEEPVALPKNRVPAAHVSQDARRAMRWGQSEAQEYHGESMIGAASLVASRELELCLPMNRQKHAVRDVWSRLTSEDMRHKTALKKTNSAPNVAWQSQHGSKALIKHENMENTHSYRTHATKALSERISKRY
ncbi:hypothetical protein RRG08_031516 [Elysia crispata]|uniref:Uncharacterized protein n=1 Tax=Elysia crispata TaxID=231223 RepID=A0AAE1CEX9_9GAST|nr:hypothetical protein RRG08_031516 [Elysia crispata]